jgi:hypothetical protein
VIWTGLAIGGQECRAKPSSVVKDERLDAAEQPRLVA